MYPGQQNGNKQETQETKQPILATNEIRDFSTGPKWRMYFLCF